MPAPSFLQGVARNLRYWHAQCVPFSDVVLEIFTVEALNLTQALLAGFAFPETHASACALTLALFECIEARGAWQTWQPILEKSLATENLSVK
ncbi:MAG: hypothetical protein H6636_14695 [Anaerolineales bacterium]|nr:hypothetical protein [Anaerolineales bacterium]